MVNEDHDMEDVSDKPSEQPQIVKEGDSTLIVTSFDDDTSTVDNISKFLTRWQPSITSDTHCNWIAIDRGGHRPRAREPDLQGLMASFESLKTSGNVSVPSIDAIARTHGVLSGKWLVYSYAPQVDTLWARIVAMICLDLKRGSVKVSPRQEGQPHVICVYADDYTDEKEVRLIREAARVAGVVWKIGFKPDVYTHLGIYKRNSWNIRPTLYHA